MKKLKKIIMGGLTAIALANTNGFAEMLPKVENENIVKGNAVKPPNYVEQFGPWEILTIVYSGVKTKEFAKILKPYIEYYNIPAYLDSVPEIARPRIELSLEIVKVLTGEKVDERIEEIIIKNLEDERDKKKINLILDFVYNWEDRTKLTKVAKFIKEKENKSKHDYIIYSLITGQYLKDTPEDVRKQLDYIKLNPKDYTEDGTLIVVQVFDSKNWFENSVKSFMKYALQFGKVKETKKNEDGWKIVIITAGRLKLEFAYPEKVSDKRTYVHKAAKYADIIAYRGDIIYQEQFITPEDINTGRKMIVWFGSCFSAPYIPKYREITGNKIKYIANRGTGYGWANIRGIKTLISKILKNDETILFSDLKLENEMKKAVGDVMITYPSIRDITIE